MKFLILYGSHVFLETFWLHLSSTKKDKLVDPKATLPNIVVIFFVIKKILIKLAYRSINASSL